jgi:hypothetical protein
MAKLAPDQPFGVTDEMCGTCDDTFLKLAQQRKVIQVVYDPKKEHIFVPS